MGLAIGLFAGFKIWKKKDVKTATGPGGGAVKEPSVQDANAEQAE